MNLQSIAADLQAIKDAVLCSKRVLSFDEAAHYTGYSRSYLYKLTSSGVIPFSKPNGKIIFFDREKLDDWLLSNSTTSIDEKERSAAGYVSAKLRK